MQWFRQLFGRPRPPIPDDLWQACTTGLPFLRHLSPDDIRRLKVGTEGLLASKSMNGAGGLALTDEIAVLIAVQASLLTLNLSADLYRDIAGIVVYPGEFIVPQSEIDEAGVVHEWQEPVSGEAIQSGGAVILSWEDVLDAESLAVGYNVVLHEFAHKIDMLRGDANGCPPFLAAFHQGLDVRTWQQVFSAAYQDFVGLVDAMETRLPDPFDPDDPEHVAQCDGLEASLPMDPYAAVNAAEFFAVSTEAFFVASAPLAHHYPELYQLLARYYRQDPLAAAVH